MSAFLQKTDHPPFQIKLLFSATIRHSPALPHTAAVAPARDLVLKRIMCDCLSLAVERRQRDGTGWVAPSPRRYPLRQVAPLRVHDSDYTRSPYHARSAAISSAV